MKKIVKSFLKRKLEIRQRKLLLAFWDREDQELRKCYSSPQLTMDEREKLKSYWKKYVKEDIPLTYYELIKGIDKFDTDYISHSIYFTYMLPILNPRAEAYALANKGIYSFYFSDVYRPTEVIKNIHGNFYDENNKLCTKEDAVTAILEYKKKVVIKPSIDSSQGRNVIILSDYLRNDILEIFNKYSKDFVVQELIKQSEQTAKFNPTSLNTFRITTLLLNGKFSCLSIIFRCGGLNSIVDNVNAGGIMIGVYSDGKLYDYGFSKKEGKRAMSYNGLRFSEYRIDNFSQILDFAHTLHLRLPFCSIVGWDIALDYNNRPIMVEVNLKGPSIDVEQMCSGPTFGNRLQEVLDYVFNKN